LGEEHISLRGRLVHTAKPKIQHEQRLWQPQGVPICEMCHTLEPDEDQ
jgi:hypothetical protein